MTLVCLIAGKMHEMKATAKQCATAAGMSEATFRRRMKNPDAFTVGELNALTAFLRCKEDFRRMG